MKIFRFILFFLILSSIIFSCKEVLPPNNYRYQKISKSLYPQLFNKGSYWIYSNPDTAIIDSVSVITVELIPSSLGHLDRDKARQVKNNITI